MVIRRNGHHAAKAPLTNNKDRFTGIISPT